MSKLAIHGGAPVRTKPFPSQNTIDATENLRKALDNLIKENKGK